MTVQIEPEMRMSFSVIGFKCNADVCIIAHGNVHGVYIVRVDSNMSAFSARCGFPGIGTNGATVCTVSNTDRAIILLTAVIANNFIRSKAEATR